MEKKRELMKKKAINFPLNLRHRRHKAEKMSAADPMKNEILTLNWRMEDKHENDTISKMNRVITTNLQRLLLGVLLVRHGDAGE